MPSRTCTTCALLTLMVLAAACNKQPIPEPALQTVSAATVEEIHSDTPERYSATISASAQVDLAFKSAGIIDRIHQVKGADGRIRDVQAGDYVAEGTELAVVRRLDYEQRVQQSQDQTALAEAQRAQAEVALRQAELDYTRATNLYQTASITKPEYEQARTRLDSATAQVAGA
jgi:multidrug resistance efflux pump